jgi:DNA-binding NarL/FixJ family response regulator
MTEPSAARILIVDDHDVVHWGFRLLLERQPWVERCQAAGDAEKAVEIRESGAEVCEEIRAASPGTRVLLISGAGSISPTVARAAGASGFISKDWAAADVVKAVRMVALGTEVFTDAAEAPIALSAREQEVLDLIASGATNGETAKHLHLSPHTIKDYTTAIYRKLGVRNRAEAVRRAQELQLFP